MNQPDKPGVWTASPLVEMPPRRKFTVTRQSDVKGLMARREGDNIAHHVTQWPDYQDWRMERQSDNCTWTETEYGHDTGCGKVFVLIAGNPMENGFVYCPYCGEKIEEKLP